MGFFGGSPEPAGREYRGYFGRFLIDLDAEVVRVRIDELPDCVITHTSVPGAVRTFVDVVDEHVLGPEPGRAKI